MVFSGLVSVIIPISNVQDFLPKALSCILTQTYKNLEILCVINNSQDRSTEIAEQFKERDKRIKIFTLALGGAGRARNFGLSKARGEYVYFFDSDDIIDHKYIESLVIGSHEGTADIVINPNIFRFIENEKEYIVSTEKVLSKQGTKDLEKLQNHHQNPVKYHFYEKDFEEKIINTRENYYVVWNKLYKKQFLDEHHLFFSEDKQHEDTPFNLYAIYLSKMITFLDSDNPSFYFYRWSPNSLINTVDKGLDIYYIYRDYEETLSLNPMSSIHESIFNTIILKAVSGTSASVLSRDFSLSLFFKSLWIEYHLLKKINKKLLYQTSLINDITFIKKLSAYNFFFLGLIVKKIYFIFYKKRHYKKFQKSFNLVIQKEKIPFI